MLESKHRFAAAILMNIDGQTPPHGPIPAGPPKRNNYLPSLDGWRTVAILWVIEAHNQPWHWGPFNNRWLQQRGDHGVQLFFALSGLLICTRLLHEEQRFGAISLRSFYTRRLFRIQPAALVYLAAVCALMLLGYVRRVWDAVAAAALMVRNFLPRYDTNWETAHFWSLAVEEHFYLLLPGFLVLCRRRRIAWLCLVLLALELWRLAVFAYPKLQGATYLIYLRTDLVIDGILLGSLFALALTRPPLRRLAQTWLRPWVALLYAAAVFISQELHSGRSDHAVLMTVYPVLLTATVLHPESWTTRFLELPPLRFVGRISYSLYLWQELFFFPFRPPTPGSLHAHTLLCWAATFACAIASYYLVETPLIRRGHRVAHRFDIQPQPPVAAQPSLTP
jgi:peptidoglycan/LPS O-acetylase OafA/YrhL